MYSHTHHHISRLIKKHTAEKIPTLLDYGCGSGDLLMVVKPKQLKQYYGFDINQHSLSALINRFRNKNITTQLVDTKKKLYLGKTESVDAVISTGVLQYMSDKQINELFKEVDRVLKRKGVFIFSCAHDQLLYKLCNLYGKFLPHRYFTRLDIVTKLRRNKLTLKYMQARGPLLNPLFSYFVIFFFDAIDKVVFKTKGTIGPVGTFVRKLSRPILSTELDADLNVGYTLFVVATK